MDQTNKTDGAQSNTGGDPEAEGTQSAAPKPSPTPDAPKSGGDTQSAKANSEEQSSESKTFTQAEVNALLRKERLKADKDHKDQAQAAKDEAERQAAEKAGQFETLYKTEQARVKTVTEQLTAAQTEIADLRAIVTRTIDEQIKDWPDEVTALDPKRKDPEGYSVKDRLDWLKAASKLAARLQDAPKPLGNYPGPAPKSNGAKPVDTGSRVNPYTF